MTHKVGVEQRLCFLNGCPKRPHTEDNGVVRPWQVGSEAVTPGRDLTEHLEKVMEMELRSKFIIAHKKKQF